MSYVACCVRYNHQIQWLLRTLKCPLDHVATRDGRIVVFKRMEALRIYAQNKGIALTDAYDQPLAVNFDFVLNEFPNVAYELDTVAVDNVIRLVWSMDSSLGREAGVDELDLEMDLCEHRILTDVQLGILQRIAQRGA